MSRHPNVLVSCQSDPSPAPAGSYLMRGDILLSPLNNQHQNNQSDLVDELPNNEIQVEGTDGIQEDQDDEQEKPHSFRRLHRLADRLDIHTPRRLSKGYHASKDVIRGGVHAVERTVIEVGHQLNKVKVINKGVSFFTDYRKFIDRGNVVDLSVAVVVGTAFTAIVTSMVTDIITPIIALASGKNLEENFVILRKNNNATVAGLGNPKTRQQAQNMGDITWNWGNFIQTVFNFFITSGCVFLVVKLYEKALAKKKKADEKTCEYCLKSIPLKAARCPNCTTWIDWAVCTKVNNLELEAKALPTEPAPNPQAQDTYPVMKPVEQAKRVARSL